MTDALFRMTEAAFRMTEAVFRMTDASLRMTKGKDQNIREERPECQGVGVCITKSAARY